MCIWGSYGLHHEEWGGKLKRVSRKQGAEKEGDDISVVEAGNRCPNDPFFPPTLDYRESIADRTQPPLQEQKSLHLFAQAPTCWTHRQALQSCLPRWSLEPNPETGPSASMAFVNPDLHVVPRGSKTGTAIIPVRRRRRQEDCKEFKTLGYRASLRLQISLGYKVGPNIKTSQPSKVIT